MSAQIDQLIDDYLDAYSESDQARRASGVTHLDGRPSTGRPIAREPGSRRDRAAGASAVEPVPRPPLPALDRHRCTSRLRPLRLATGHPAGETTFEVWEFAEVEGSGRLQRVVGFFGTMPQAGHVA